MPSTRENENEVRNWRCYCMVSITLSRELFKKLENLREGEESIEKVIEQLIESYEELQDYIEEKYEKLRRDRDKFVNLEDYAASRGL